MKSKLFGALFFLTAALLAAEGHSADPGDVMAALARISTAKVPRANLQCEINGPRPDGDAGYNDVTVADIFANHASWSLYESTYKVQSFECEGKNIQKCSWAYGERPNPKNPGWQQFINFEYNSKTGEVLPASLQCVQVP